MSTTTRSNLRSRRHWGLAVATSLGLLLLPPLVTAEASTRSIESLLRRNPRGKAIVEDMARQGSEEAMLVLCEGGVGAASADGRSALVWCSRGAALGSPRALRELGMRLLSRGDAVGLAEGTRVMVLAEVMGDPTASLEVSLLPDFFGVGTGTIATARREAMQRIEAGRFHEPETLGLTFEFTPPEREVLRRRLARALRKTAALGADTSELGPQLAARRRQAEHRELVSGSARTAHRQHLEGKDALQARLAADLKRASEEWPGLTDRERSAKASRLERLRTGGELLTARIDAKSRAQIEAEAAALLTLINRHRAPEAALRIEDLGLPWQAPDRSSLGPTPATERE